MVTVPTPRLLFVGNFLSETGLNRTFVEDMSDRIEQRGWSVIRTSRYRQNGRRLADMLWTIWTRRRDYDLAHVDVYSGAAFVWAEAACALLHRLGKPFVLTLRGGNLPEFAAKWPTRVRRLLQSARVVTVPSRYLGEQLQPYRHELELVPNAIDLATLPFTHRERAAPKLTWVRAFHAVYNPTLAVDVLAVLRTRYPDATLTMLGPDKDGSRALVEARAREVGVDGALTVVGQVPKPQLGTYLAAADIFLNTTDIDNTPVSVLEGMAAGLCVVSTNVGGIPYLLDDDRTALLVPPRDAAAMVAAITRILDAEGVASRLSQAAHDFASTCDWTPILDRWETLLHAVARR